jgi:hypothetical protein
MKHPATICFFLISLCCTPASAAQAPKASDSSEDAAAALWETPSEPTPVPPRCAEIARALIAPVTSNHRADAIARLSDTQFIEISEAEATELTGVRLNSPNPSLQLRPFLVRAVAKNEVPAFAVNICGDVLHVVHGSLGRSAPPPSHRVPLVIMLDRVPSRVEVGWRIAG